MPHGYLPLGGGETTSVIMDLPDSIYNPGIEEAALNLILLMVWPESKSNTDHPKGRNEVWKRHAMPC